MFREGKIEDKPARFIAPRCALRNLVRRMGWWYELHDRLEEFVNARSGPARYGEHFFRAYAQKLCELRFHLVNARRGRIDFRNDGDDNASLRLRGGKRRQRLCLDSLRRVDEQEDSLDRVECA